MALVDELLDAARGAASATGERHADGGLGGLALVALLLRQHHHTLAGGVLLHAERTRLDGALEARLVQPFRVEWVLAEVLAHAASLHEVARRVARDQPIQIARGADTVHHLEFGEVGFGRNSGNEEHKEVNSNQNGKNTHTQHNVRDGKGRAHTHHKRALHR